MQASHQKHIFLRNLKVVYSKLFTALMTAFMLLSLGVPEEDRLLQTHDSHMKECYSQVRMPETESVLVSVPGYVFCIAMAEQYTQFVRLI